MNLTLSRAFLMPERCACCLGAPDSGLEAGLTKTIFLVIVSVRRTARVSVPYCRKCVAHVNSVAGWRIILMTFFVWVLSFFVSAFLWKTGSWLDSYSSMSGVRSFLNAAAMLLPWMLALGFCVHQFLRRGRAPGRGHARFGPAVELIDFSDESLTLEVHNSKFGALMKAAQSVSVPAPTATVSAAPKPVPMEVSNESVRRRLATIPRDAKPERVLRFVAFKCEIEDRGIVATYSDGTSRTLAWGDIASLYMRRLPHDPPWERMLVMDLVPREGVPTRVLATTVVNFRDLPGGAANSHLENCRRLAAHLVEQNPDVMLDPETRAFVTGFGPCAALSGIEQFLRYDDQFTE